MAVLLREAIGDRLRHARTNQERTLREISRTARVSLGYLSEVERGQKEPSSELLAAICEALELPMSELLYNVAGDVAAVDAVALEGELGTRSEPETAPPAGKQGEITNSVGGRPALRTTISSPGVGVFAA